MRSPPPYFIDRPNDWPNLTHDNHRVESWPTRVYNCIAWAYEVNDRRLWPGAVGYFWPANITGADDLQTLKNLFIDAGYEECSDGLLEEGYKKVAIYVNNEGPQHAALQLESGHWTSKLGSLEDIEHHTLEALEGDFYGKATVFLKKPRG